MNSIIQFDTYIPDISVLPQEFAELDFESLGCGPEAA